MNPIISQWGPVAVIVGGYLLGIYFQSRSIARLDHRIDDLRDAMNKSFDDFHDLLKSQVKRFERLEHPIVRQS